MTTYYVKQTGSDAADGLGWATAWKTIDKGLTSRSSGDIVYILSGVYLAGASRALTGTVGGVIQVIGIGDYAPFISGALNLGNSSYSKLQWLHTYTGGNWSAGGFYLNTLADQMTIQDCIVQGWGAATSDGIAIDIDNSLGGTKKAFILNNTIYGFGDIGIGTGSNANLNILASGNYISQCGTGISSRAVSIYHNLISGCTTGIDVIGSTWSPIYNNTIVSCTKGIFGNNGTSDARNNIILNCSSGIIRRTLYTPATNWCANNYNLFHQNNNDIIYNSGGLNNKFTDPLINSSTVYDLSAGSPCIDSGIYVGLPYQENNPDIGWWEYLTPEAPPVLIITGFTQTFVDLSWSRVGSFNTYLLSYGTDVAATNLGELTVHGVSTSIYGLNPNTHYYFKVKRIN
jgi:hypothetical protein